MINKVCGGRFCARIFYGLIELAAFVLTVTVVAWYSQSLQPVVELIDPPTAIVETREYFEIRWHTRLLQDCHTEGQPIIYTDFASEHLPTYTPIYSSKEPQLFTRRYLLPSYLVALHDAHSGTPHVMELRLTVIAKCNPLWTAKQLIVIPFKIPRKN